MEGGGLGCRQAKKDSASVVAGAHKNILKLELYHSSSCRGLDPNVCIRVFREEEPI